MAGEVFAEAVGEAAETLNAVDQQVGGRREYRLKASGTGGTGFDMAWTEPEIAMLTMNTVRVGDESPPTLGLQYMRYLNYNALSLRI
jgi:hypothetical protein